MTATITIELGFLPPRELWGKAGGRDWPYLKAKKKMKRSGFDHGVFELRDFYLVPKISLKYFFHHNYVLDLDNMIIAMKPWQDGLVQAEVVIDDNANRVQLERPEFVRCKEGESKTVVEVREI
ncbi:hypothetical protein CMI37_28835 [Candidatus Pacearchaeota archaeon]|nr:hypothetical protein [Candidatus Pacearchaeota archaeon]|tara:strand:+ start:2404 stop:2772 length:369 start_codon:yes stop_codon:yes gene_type:complete